MNETVGFRAALLMLEEEAAGIRNELDLGEVSVKELAKNAKTIDRLVNNVADEYGRLLAVRHKQRPRPRPPAPGRCTYCGCIENCACELEGGDSCAWIDKSQTVCSNPDCVAKHKARKKSAKMRGAK